MSGRTITQGLMDDERLNPVCTGPRAEPVLGLKVRAAAYPSRRRS